MDITKVNKDLAIWLYCIKYNYTSYIINSERCKYKQLYN